MAGSACSDGSADAASPDDALAARCFALPVLKRPVRREGLLPSAGLRKAARSQGQPTQELFSWLSSDLSLLRQHRVVNESSAKVLFIAPQKLAAPS